MKFSCYVAIMFGNEIKFVTSFNNRNHTCNWVKGERALRLAESVAKSIVEGLVCNGYFACVVKFPATFEPSNF